MYITNNANSHFWFDKGLTVHEWKSGRLADEGEGIQLESNTGIIFDRVRYYNQNPWPAVNDVEGIVLKAANLDNHFADSWMASSDDNMVDVDDLFAGSQIEVYPNPFEDKIYLKGLLGQEAITIFQADGRKVLELNALGYQSDIDVSVLNKGVYVLKVGEQSFRLLKK